MAGKIKASVSLANVTAKQHFLMSCLDHNVVPNGFNLKFSLQTGLPQDSSDGFQVLVKDVLSTAALELLRVAIDAESAKSEILYRSISDALNQLVNGEDRRNSRDWFWQSLRKF